MEFRHQSWFTEPVYDALRDRDVALTIADQDDFETPFVATATWGYLRLHRSGYDEGSLGRMGPEDPGAAMAGGIRVLQARRPGERAGSGGKVRGGGEGVRAADQPGCSQGG